MQIDTESKYSEVDPKRLFVPKNFDPSNWAEVENLLTQLLDREIKSNEDLEQWVLDGEELSSVLSEAKSRRYIAMSCNTESKDLEKSYMTFVEEILQRAKPITDKLHRKFLTSAFRKSLDDRYKVLDRGIEAEVELFREKNIPIQTELTQLSQRYQQIVGAMMVEFEGREQTLPQVSKYLEAADRSLRERAWRAVWERRIKDEAEISALFDRMVSLRDKVAKNANCKDFSQYAFKMYQRFDYSEKDCRAFQETVESIVVPVLREIGRDRCSKLKLSKLRPWDVAVDPFNREPLRPFSNIEELTSGVAEILNAVDPFLGNLFGNMNKLGELDLDSRKGKAPGGYLATLDECRRPFIFMNAAGVHRDVETLLHECGHAFHSLLCSNDPLLTYRHSPIEFAEVASMSMELFGDSFLEKFYSKEEAIRARQKRGESIIDLLCWVAQIDAFQFWLYSNPTHSHESRALAWMDLTRRFGQDLDWIGLENISRISWQRQPHLFCNPFYYIEYGIAQLGALQLWKRFKLNPSEAITSYKKALTLGGSKPLPELFKAAGIAFDFSEKVVRPLVLELREATLG